jgi:Leucine rich repeat/TIR domain
MDSTEIYFDGNNFPDLQNHAFIGRKNLRVLFVNASNVITIQNRTFSGLPALRVLHLDHNKIQRLQGYEFETLSLLKELYLQNNLISYIANNSFAQLFSLEILRLDGNRLVTMPMWQVQLDQMAHLAMISLGRNAWSCRCKFLQELTGYVSENALIVQDSQDIFCIDASKNRELDFNTTSVCTDIYSDSSTMTHGIPNGYIPLVIAGLILLFLVITIIIITAFRESLKLWLFAHYDVRVFGPRCEETEKLYDAVLLHSAKDTDYVVHSIASDLESGRPTLRLCLQHRDLSEDATYLQILEAARASRRLVLILTRNFLQTEWSRCDLRRAVHDALQGRLQKLVVIEELETISEAENDIELMPYLKTTSVNRIRRNDKHFWEKLRYALPNDAPYRGNNYTIDHHHERVKQPVNTGIVYRQAPPPAYCPDIDEANYSSAATATPSPRPQRRGQQQINDPNLHRPPSEHIYLSIDSDYGAMECNDQMVSAGPDGIHRTMWRCGNPLAGGVADAQYIPSHGNQSQSYLV